MQIYKVGLYIRVSTSHDEQINSVNNQELILKNWLEIVNDGCAYELIEVYKDIGMTGSNFDRPEFKRLLADMGSGTINMIMVKDLSRLGRNLSETTKYIEEIFPLMKVRFISLGDSIDTKTTMNEDIVPFLNIVNEMYSKDISKKIKSSLNTLMNEGSLIASRPPYGYEVKEVIKDGRKFRYLEIASDNSPKVVKSIFDMYCDGLGYAAIASVLNNRDIEPPSKKYKSYTRNKYSKWSAQTIKTMLSNPKYCGVMAQSRFKKYNRKLKVISKTEEVDWIIGVPFIGIITKDVFENVSKRMSSNNKNKLRYKNGLIHKFSGVLKCNECGAPMTYKQRYKGYKCSNAERGAGRCTAHSVKEKFLVDKVTENINGYLSEIDLEKYYGKFNDVRSTEKLLNNEKAKIKKTIDENTKKTITLYDDKIAGIIDDDSFKLILGQITKGNKALELRLKEIEAIVVKTNNIDIALETFKCEIDKLAKLEDLTRFEIEMIVKKIIVSEDKLTKSKSVEIQFYFEKEPMLSINQQRRV